MTTVYCAKMDFTVRTVLIIVHQVLYHVQMLNNAEGARKITTEETLYAQTTVLHAKLTVEHAEMDFTELVAKTNVLGIVCLAATVQHADLAEMAFMGMDVSIGVQHDVFHVRNRTSVMPARQDTTVVTVNLNALATAFLVLNKTIAIYAFKDFMEAVATFIVP